MAVVKPPIVVPPPEPLPGQEIGGIIEGTNVTTVTLSQPTGEAPPAPASSAQVQTAPTKVDLSTRDGILQARASGQITAEQAEYNLERNRIVVDRASGKLSQKDAEKKLKEVDKKKPREEILAERSRGDLTKQQTEKQLKEARKQEENQKPLKQFSYKELIPFYGVSKSTDRLLENWGRYTGTQRIQGIGNLAIQAIGDVALVGSVAEGLPKVFIRGERLGGATAEVRTVATDSAQEIAKNATSEGFQQSLKQGNGTGRIIADSSEDYLKNVTKIAPNYKGVPSEIVASPSNRSVGALGETFDALAQGGKTAERGVIELDKGITRSQASELASTLKKTGVKSITVREIRRPDLSNRTANDLVDALHEARGGTKLSASMTTADRAKAEARIAAEKAALKSELKGAGSFEEGLTSKKGADNLARELKGQGIKVKKDVVKVEGFTPNDKRVIKRILEFHPHERSGGGRGNVLTRTPPKTDFNKLVVRTGGGKAIEVQLGARYVPKSRQLSASPSKPAEFASPGTRTGEQTVKSPSRRDEPATAPKTRPNEFPSPSRKPFTHPTDVPSAKPSAKPTEKPQDKPSTTPRDEPRDKPQEIPKNEPKNKPEPKPEPKNQPKPNPTKTKTQTKEARGLRGGDTRKSSGSRVTRFPAKAVFLAGNQWKTFDFNKRKIVASSRRRPLGVPAPTGGRTPRETYRIIEYDNDPPLEAVGKLGGVDVTFTEGGIKEFTRRVEFRRRRKPF